MDDLHKRGLAFENKFAKDEEINFIITSNACHIFGHWLATEKLHLSGSAAEAYSAILMHENLRHGNKDTILDLARAELEQHEIDIDPIELKKQFAAAHRQAAEEFKKTLH